MIEHRKTIAFIAICIVLLMLIAFGIYVIWLLFSFGESGTGHPIDNGEPSSDVGVTEPPDNPLPPEVGITSLRWSVDEITLEGVDEVIVYLFAQGEPNRQTPTFSGDATEGNPLYDYTFVSVVDGDLFSDEGLAVKIGRWEEVSGEVYGTDTIVARIDSGDGTIITATLTIHYGAGSTLTISAITGSGGSISPAGATTVKYGESVTYTITPANGYRIADVKVDGESVGKVSSYTFSGVNKGHTISASFSKISGSGGSGGGSGGSDEPSDPEPCPVCGETQHPSKMSIEDAIEHGYITYDDLTEEQKTIYAADPDGLYWSDFWQKVIIDGGLIWN